MVKVLKNIEFVFGIQDKPKITYVASMLSLFAKSTKMSVIVDLNTPMKIKESKV